MVPNSLTTQKLDSAIELQVTPMENLSLKMNPDLDVRKKKRKDEGDQPSVLVLSYDRNVRG